MLIHIEKTAQPNLPLNKVLNRELASSELCRFQFGDGYLLYQPGTSKEVLSLLLKPDVYQLIDYQRQLPEIKVSKNDYTSPRPFVVSAFFSQMIARLFPISLSAKLPREGSDSETKVSLAAIESSKGSHWLGKVFESLDWNASIKQQPWDASFEDWGESPFYNIEFLCSDSPHELLQKLYAILPLLDENKDSWHGSEELKSFKDALDSLQQQYPALSTLISQPEEASQAISDLQLEDDFQSLPRLEEDSKTSQEDLASLKQANAWLEESLERQSLLNTALHDILRHNLKSHNFKMIETDLMGKVPIPLTEYMTAVDVVNQIPIHPKRLFFQPPTMCFPVTSKQEGYLEHPTEIFAHYQKVGVKAVICEQKHMGGRISLLVCKQESIANKSFSLPKGQRSSCLYRVKPDASAFEFLQWENALREKGLFKHVETVIDDSGIWESTEANWLLLDCELMPWAISNEPIQQVTGLYAGLASASLPALGSSINLLNQHKQTDETVSLLNKELLETQGNHASYQNVYRRYCAPINKLEDIKLAPFHVLASDKGLYTHASHEWHMKIAEILSERDPLNVIQKTEHICVNLESNEEQAEAIAWWQELTNRGDEGMVIKPIHFTELNNDALVQPAIKCRGKDYIRMVYGPNYLNHLDSLRQRVTSTKERLAFFEFALGVEGLKRLVDHKPTNEVLECYIATLALECSYKVRLQK